MSKRYPPEVREKAVRLALERLDEYGTPYAAAQAIAPRLADHEIAAALAAPGCPGGVGTCMRAAGSVSYGV